MDTPSSKNGSYLVYAAGLVGALALIFGIYNMSKISKLGKQVGSVDVAGLATRVDTVESKAGKAADDASRAVTRISGVATDANRALDQVGAELASLRTTVTKLQSDTKALTEAPVRSSGGGAAAGAGPAPGTLSEDGSYVIKAGDTFGKLAAQFGVTIADIERANPGVDSRRLRIGQRIVVPKKS